MQVASSQSYIVLRQRLVANRQSSPFWAISAASGLAVAQIVFAETQGANLAYHVQKGANQHIAQISIGSFMRNALDLNDVQIFASAARAGSLSKAAKELGLPTSTVSRSLTRLEKHLGLLLVRRGQRGLLLTDAGSEYLNSVSKPSILCATPGNSWTETGRTLVACLK
jgi:DNA-binding MarR family transcriptional regulator